MKVTITHLKAPWPAGAQVGDVVEVPGDEVPGSLVGKFVPADADAEATHVYAPVLPKAVLAEARLAAPGAGDLQARLDAATRAAADALQLADQARDAAAETQAKLADAEAALTASKAEGDELRKKLADAEAALTAAQAAQSKKK